MRISLTHRLSTLSKVRPAELTSAILLIIESELTQENRTPLAKPILSPILMPEDEASLTLGILASLIKLLLTLPPGRGQRGCETAEAHLLGGLGRTAQTLHETPEATATALRLILKPLDGGEPRLMVIRALDPSEAKSLSMTAALVAADGVLLIGGYVRVIEIDRGADVMINHPLDDGGRAGRAAGVEHDGLRWWHCKSRAFHIRWLR